MSEAIIEAIPLSKLPAVMSEYSDGTFVGLISSRNQHFAVVRLHHSMFGKQRSWGQAKAWALSVSGDLPTRAVAALCYHADPKLVSALYYWTCEPGKAGWAWAAGRGDKFEAHDFATFELGVNAECAAFAVRCIPVIGAAEADGLLARVSALESRLALSLSDRVEALEAALAGKA